jgi:hypothetical protein
MKTADRGNPNNRATERTEFMGRKVRTILAHSDGLESEKKSGRRRGIFLDFPFYRTYQDLTMPLTKGFLLGRTVRSHDIIEKHALVPGSYVAVLDLVSARSPN